MNFIMKVKKRNEIKHFIQNSRVYYSQNTQSHNTKFWIFPTKSEKKGLKKKF